MHAYSIPSRSLLCLLVALLSLGARAWSMVTTDYPAVPRPFKILYVPYEVTAGPGAAPHAAWFTAAAVEDALFKVGFSPPPLPDGSPACSGSVRDYFQRQIPGTDLVRVLLPFPPDKQVNGVYQLDATTTAPAVPTDREASWQLMRVLLNRLGYGNGPETPHGRPIASPMLDAKQFFGVDAIYYVTVGRQDGSARGPDGVNTIFLTLGTGPALEYSWIGVATHESAHALGILNDPYHVPYEGIHIFNIMSAGMGPYPAPMTAWMRHRHALPRRMHKLYRGMSEILTLPSYAAGPGELPEYLLLPDGTQAFGGENDLLFVEQRTRKNLDPWDTARAGLPMGNTSGLYVQPSDVLQQSSFASGGNLRHFTDPLGDAEDLLSDNLGPLAYHRSASGDRTTGVLYEAGKSFARAPRGAALNRVRTCANKDGNIIWELMNLQAGAAGAMQCEVAFRGVPFAQAVGALGVGRSPNGLMQRGFGPQNQGWFIYDALPLGSLEPHQLRIYSNRVGTAFRTTLTTLHPVAPAGEVFTFSLLGGTMDYSASTVDATISVRARGGAVLRQISQTVGAQALQGQFDLTPWTGQWTEVVIDLTAPIPFSATLTDAYFFRKNETVLRDFVREGSLAALNESDPAPDPDGKIGWANNVALEDGVTYARCLAMKPQEVANGHFTWTFPALDVPSDGALLRGSLGFLASAAGVSNGAALRLLLDDGKHIWEIRNSDQAAPITTGNTLVCPASGSPISFPTVTDWATGDAAGQAWNDPFYATWRGGDWVRTGDVDGDGNADVVVFTGGRANRVLVAKSTSTRFDAQEVWHAQFCAPGNRPFLGDFDGDGKKDILCINPKLRTAQTAISSTTLINGIQYFDSVKGASLAGIAGEKESVLTGDVNGDGRDDIVIFTLETEPSGSSRVPGTISVCVADPGGGLRAPQVWSVDGPKGSDTPLLGDITSDGWADAIKVSATGVATFNPSSREDFGPSLPWVTNGPSHPAADATFLGEQIYPGTRFTSGAVPFYAKLGGIPRLVWFNRSAVAEPAMGDVMMAWRDIAGDSQLQKLHEFFCLGETWPAIADFSGDRNPDLLCLNPTVLGSTNANGDTAGRGATLPKESLTIQDPTPPLYFSPKIGQDLTTITTQNNTQYWRRKLNRFEIDFSSLANKRVRLTVELEAGPSAAADYILWPEFKLYGKPQVYPSFFPNLIVADITPGLVRLLWSLNEESTENLWQPEYSYDLKKWFPVNGQTTPAGSMFYSDIQLPTGSPPPQFFGRLFR